MAPIRTVLVGLSASSKTSWAADAHLPYLLSERGRSKFQLVGLLNSSKSAAEKAISAFNLPSSTKAYGSPHDLVDNLDVDLTIVCTRVDTHYGVARPLVQAGRMVYVEWPLTQNKDLAAELADIADSNNARTIVGTQARVAPYTLKVKELLQAGTIGKVVSSDLNAFHSNTPNAGLPEGLEYFTDSKIGGNVLTIAFAHTIDGVHSVLGEFETFTSQGRLVNPTVNLVNDGKVVRQVQTDVPDEVYVHGQLTGNEHVQPGAVLTLTYRRNPVPFPDEPALLWSIFGEIGQLRITSQNNTFLNVDSSGLQIRLHKYGTTEIEEVPWQYEEWQEALPTSSRNISALYERFAAGLEIPTFKDAVQRHEEIDTVLHDFHERLHGK